MESTPEDNVPHRQDMLSDNVNRTADGAGETVAPTFLYSLVSDGNQI
jgi:hypothetical protein